MKAAVDHDLCIGCALCADLAPEVFEMRDDDLAHVVVEEVPAEAEGTAEEAKDSCPTEAISVE